MTFPVLASNGSSGYNLTRSLRFRASATASLTRTPASAGNRKTMTFSAWVKIGTLGVQYSTFWSAGSASPNPRTEYGFSYETLYLGLNTSGSAWQYVQTNAVFRDPSAWYHIVFAIDTTQATSTNRVKVYINGVQVTAFASYDVPSQNTDLPFNNAVAQYLGRYAASTSQQFDGYMTEVNFIDGQALTPSSFGSTNTLTGVWQPARYVGAYGTNGFYLPFTDNSALTTNSNVGLGKDFSGNGNYWTTNNISITAGPTYDSMTDVPTLTSPTAANFCTLNPLSTTAGTYSNANLRYVGASAWRRTNSTIAVNSGKFYWEVKLGNAPYSPVGSNTQYNGFGFGLATVFNSATSPTVATDAVTLCDNGYYKNFSGALTSSGLTFSSGDVLAIAVDLGANTFTFYRNNSSVVTGTIGVTAGTTLTPIVISYDGTYGIMDANFGQQPFTYTPPTGFVALNTYNLSDSTIVKGNTVMDATLYTGNSSTQTVTNAGAFEPDLVWIKNRSATSQHVWTDSVRGVTKQLFSSLTNAEQTSATGITSLNSNGFSLGTNVSPTGDTNSSPNSFVAWQWLESASAGFDIVTFTGNGGGQTFAHGLGVAPGLMICKSLNNAQDWYVYHSSIGGTGALLLNTTAGTQTSVSYWSNVTPGSGTFSVGGNFSNGYTYINYLFAPIAGFSAFGSYTGNGSTNGPFVYTGFRPRWVLIKASSTTSQWVLWDTARNTYNVTNSILYPNLSAVEASFSIDILSNGFKFREAGGAGNDSGVTYIYAAFAENPFKNALAR